MTDTLVVDDLTFDLRRSPARKTLRLTVDRGGELLLTAPDDLPVEQIESFAREKRFWIYTKLAQKDRLMRPKVQKEYVSGESFHYLGRTHRLRLLRLESADAADGLRLQHGQFVLPRIRAAEAPRLFRAWYIEHGRPFLVARVARYAERIGVMPRTVQLSDLGFRWASCSPRRRITFNWRVMQFAPRIIDYIVVHELVHLVEPKHNENFWQRVERVLPDFRGRKRWLAENGGDFS
jgi:predicted metal-dependent hydrolase